MNDLAAEELVQVIAELQPDQILVVSDFIASLVRPEEFEPAA